MEDKTDTRILEELSKNSLLPERELRGKVPLNGLTSVSRVAKLEDDGVFLENYLCLKNLRLDNPSLLFITRF